MLSPQVTEAVRIAQEKRPDLKLEGPLQYDAAVDPEVAKTKVKAHSEVAGRATVCIFPSLDTGNNTYKASTSTLLSCSHFALACFLQFQGEKALSFVPSRQAATSQHEDQATDMNHPTLDIFLWCRKLSYFEGHLQH